MDFFLSKHAWHNVQVSEVIDILKTDPDKGLSNSDVDKRVQQYGRNIITPKKQQSALVRFLLQFHQPLIYILIVAAIVTVVLGEYIDAVVIFAVVLINAVIGFVQEAKALKAIDALSKSMISKATIIRNGKKINLDASELVPGDVVMVQSGDKLPADVRLIEQRDMRVDESALTGESLSVEKGTKPVEKDTVLGDRLNMAFATTVVTYGNGKGVVVATGDYTEVGKISQSIATADELETPLTKKIREFSNLLLWVILALSALLFGIGLLRGESAADMFMMAVALAVGAIPEGLPAAVTIMLAIGVSKMAARKAIIRKLVAVETLGSTTVICSDKTGTLTENQMTVQKVYAGSNIYDVTGIGYKPEGEIFQEDKKVDVASVSALDLCLKAGLLCNDSRLVEKKGRWTIEGDPTEGAMLVIARKAGITEKEADKEYPRIDAIPFESEYQYMATLHQGERPVIFVKGSLEALLERCDNVIDTDGQVKPIDKQLIQDLAETLASEGLRVLAFAMKQAPEEQRELGHKDVAAGLTFLGLQGMIDPPREEAKKAVALCQQAGIDVKMITGDHALTASSIAGQIGLKGKMVDGKLATYTGQELQQFNDAELEEIAESTSVFARVAPDQKLRLVKALQARSKVVAMTGDGVNDGPALKQADIGIAMGITGTDMAKDAADMVLTDDDFSSIEGAVEEGRGVFDNLTKFIVWTLPTNLGEGLVIMVAVFFANTMPILPVQILWINMTTTVLLGLMLAFESKEPGIMERAPRPANQPILTRKLIMRTILVGTLIMIAAYGLFLYESSIGASIPQAQTVAATVFVVLETFYLFNCRSLVRPLKDVGLFSNPWVYVGAGIMLLLQILFIYLPVMNTLFQSAPISALSWARIVGAGIVLFIIVSLEKYLRRKNT
jgi:cation-transporting ATPase F